MPGDPGMEAKIRALVRWNAVATVIRANKEKSDLGGHIASFASAATLYDVGFNYFFRAANDKFLGDCIYIQGHSAPGIYARAFLEGRITEDQLNHAQREVIAQNGLARGAYLRPVAFRGYGEAGVVPKIDPPVEVAIAGWEWGKYLGAAEDEGVDVCVSSWQRVAPNTIPAMAKAGGNYLSSQLIGLEAKRLGFVEGIGLSTDGTVSEGAGENLFIVKDNVLYTPGIAHSLLNGITRHTVMTLAKDAGIEVREIAVPREMLYLADELFFTGTATEVAPIRSVDAIQIGNGKRGPITAKLQQAYFSLVQGKSDDKRGWLDYVDMNAPRAAVAV
jgi:branched-chain amino acid aminotransferase